MVIIKRECPDLFGAYKSCVTEKGEAACADAKLDMMECGTEAFRVVNTNPDYVL